MNINLNHSIYYIYTTNHTIRPFIMNYLLSIGLLVGALSVSAQEEKENIVKIVDDLTMKWDKQARQLETYIGLKYYCTSEQYQDNTISLLDKIHHYDTMLYGIVTEKYANSKDKEAEATLKDIVKVEADYTTKSFKEFLALECQDFTKIEGYNKSNGSKYYKETEKLEKALAKYVQVITLRIDVIDEHIHHLKLD